METEPADTSEIPRRRICAACVLERFLHDEIEREGETDPCFYCKAYGKTISIDQLSNRIDRAFDDHFEVTANEPTDFEYTLIKETDFEWYPEGTCAADAIADAAEISSDAAEDVRSILEDRHYDYDDAKMGEDSPFEKRVHYAEK